MKEKPIIGISGSIIIDHSQQFAGYHRSYVNDDYIDAVIKAGGIPYIIPVNTDSEVIKEQVAMLDGIIFSGGQDITPRFYNEEPRQKLSEIFPDRDEFEFQLLAAAEKKGIPIFGICRGFHLINVFHGGSLYQDLTYAPNEVYQHFQPDLPTDKTHHVHLEESGLLAREFGVNKLLVNSFHHQIIKELAQPLTIEAQSLDGVCEAYVNEDYKNLEFGVQWHPEMLHRVDDKMQHLFNILVNASKGAISNEE